jgi:Ca-activated chloride channel family protein
MATPASALKDFNSGNFTNAFTEYERLLNEQTTKQKPEDPRLHFNAGTAAYRATNYSVAIQHFNAVLTAKDIKLQQSAYYNLGNTHFRLGNQSEDLDKLEEAWKEAVKQYEHAVALDKMDENAAFNLAFVREGLEQIKQFKEAMLRAKSDADSAVRERNYRRAVEIMDALMQNQIAAKQFQEFTKKLKDIDGIANPQPAPK